MEAAAHCRNHRDVVEGLRRCATCAEVFCHDCLIDFSGESRCAVCKNERLLDLLSGVEAKPGTGPTVKVYSPATVGAYGILLAYPSSLLLAIENWSALGQQKRVKPHLLGFGLLTAILVVVIARKPQAARLFAFGVNLMAFSYFKQKMKTDLAEYRAGNPTSNVVIRPWYRGLGSALAGVIGLVVVGVLVALLLSAFK